jgi:sigma-B regulation protein RsbU (phosphoserine phosphatase)
MKKTKLLIVDPLWKKTSPAKKALEKNGLSVSSVNTAGEALNLMEELRPDFILLKFHPDSQPITEFLRETLRAASTVKVIVTGPIPDDASALEFMREGAADCVKGPISVGSLMPAIARIQDKERCLSLFNEPDTGCVVHEDKILLAGNDLDRVPYIVNQAVLNARYICPDIAQLKMALGEIIINAVEHGNLDISMKEKSKAVHNGTYRKLYEQRKKDERYQNRTVEIRVRMGKDSLVYQVTDEGKGFDYRKELDPDPDVHIGSGLGMFIARNFFTEVTYEGRGNSVRLVYRKAKARPEKKKSVMIDDFIVKLSDSLTSGFLSVAGDDRIVLWNSTAEAITAVKRKDVLGKAVSKAPSVIQDLLNNEKLLRTRNPVNDDFLLLEKTLYVIESKEAGKYTIVLFSNVTDAVNQKEELERLLLEMGETKDLMEEQAAKLSIALAEMEEMNEVIQGQNRRMINELEMAGRLQKSLLPDTFENINGVTFSCKYSPSIHIGGDLYDVVDVGNGQSGFMIADVSGHGVAAALISCMFKMSFHALASTVASPKILMHLLNKELRPLLNEDYITSFYVLVDRYSKSISYSNAGHPTPLLFKGSTGEIIELDTDGFFLGSFDDGGYEEKTEHNIEKGDALLLYTDCILETEDASGAQYGKERLKERFVRALKTSRGQQVIEEIENDVRNFNAKDALDDDFTVMLVEFWEEAGMDGSAPPEADADGGFVEF